MALLPREQTTVAHLAERTGERWARHAEVLGHPLTVERHRHLAGVAAFVVEFGKEDLDARLDRLGVHHRELAPRREEFTREQLRGVDRQLHGDVRCLMSGLEQRARAFHVERDERAVLHRHDGRRA